MRGCQHIGEPARIGPAAGAKARQHRLDPLHLPLGQPPAEDGMAQPREDDSPVDPHDQILVWETVAALGRQALEGFQEKKLKTKTIEEISIV